MCILPLRLPSAAALRIAWLSASLPPEVKMISLGEAPMTAAISSLAFSRYSFAFWPVLYRLEALPQPVCISSVIVRIAVSLIFVVAALSA